MLKNRAEPNFGVELVLSWGSSTSWNVTVKVELGNTLLPMIPEYFNMKFIAMPHK